MTRRVLWPFVAVLIAATIGAGLAVGGNGESNKKMFEYAIGLWGDLPYSDVQAKVGVPNLIADMNGAQLAFSVHDGDLKAGNGTPGSTTPTTCSDAPYEQGLGFSTRLKARRCSRPVTTTGPIATARRTAGTTHANGSITSARSSSARAIRSASIRSCRKCRRRLAVSASAGPTACVENRRWTLKGVTYATVNVQGSCNNLCDYQRAVVCPCLKQATAGRSSARGWCGDEAGAAAFSGRVMTVPVPGGRGLHDPICLDDDARDVARRRLRRMSDALPGRSGGRAGYELAGGFEIRCANENLARACSREVLQGRIDCLRVAPGAVDAGRLKQPADDVGLRLAGNHRQDDALARLHGWRLLHRGRERRSCSGRAHGS
jgi:hypothetical protein